MAIAKLGVEDGRFRRCGGDGRACRPRSLAKMPVKSTELGMRPGMNDSLDDALRIWSRSGDNIRLRSEVAAEKETLGSQRLYNLV